jgi:hypothetical protein
MTLTAEAPPGKYYVRIRARTSSTTSLLSNEIAFNLGADDDGTNPTRIATCTTFPKTPTGLVGTLGGGTANLQWIAASGATSYLLQAGSAPGRSDLYYKDIGPNHAVTLAVPAGFRAYFRVIGMNACGNSAASNEIYLQ